MTQVAKGVKLKQSAVAFEAHHNLLMHTIKRQAGRLEKAVLEAVMNSIDAGATHVMVDATETVVTIRDNGRGIGGEKEIDEYFKVFGTPHVEGDATFGEFRMGRGQLFAFGRNIWTSGNHQLVVDIERKGLNFDWYERAEGDPYPGCCIQIEVYDAHLSAIDSLRWNLSKQVQFADVRVDYNGERLSTPAADEKWDLVTDEFYMALTAGNTGVSVYQLGIYVEEIPKYTTGLSGIAVSRKRMKLNYARNEVMRDCEVFIKLMPALQAFNKKQQTDVEVLNPDPATRTSKLREMMKNHRLSLEKIFMRMRLFTDVAGRAWSLKQLARRADLIPQPDGNVVFSFASAGSVMADTLHRQARAFVLDDAILADLGIHRRYAGTFFDEIMGTARIGRLKFVYKEINELSEDMENQQQYIPEAEYTASEQYFMKRANAMNSIIAWCLMHFNESRSGSSRYDKVLRKLNLGLSTIKVGGWTDGRSFIALDRRFLESLGTGNKAEWKIATLLMHEYMHQESDTDQMVHGVEFYEAYHDFQQETEVLSRLSNNIAQANRRLEKVDA